VTARWQVQSQKVERKTETFIQHLNWTRIIYIESKIHFKIIWNYLLTTIYNEYLKGDKNGRIFRNKRNIQCTNRTN